MKVKNKIIVKPYLSPCGVLLLGSFRDKLCLCDWQVEKHHEHVDRRLKRILYAEFEEAFGIAIRRAISLSERRFPTVKWPGESECRRLSVLLPMPTAQMRCQSLYPVIVSLAATVL